MCTVSWDAGPDGYTLCFNRDEKRTRRPALPPARESRHGVAYLAPRDGDLGGAWLAVNVFGVTVGMLNHYADPAPPLPEAPRSRGLLVLDLAVSRGVNAVMEGLAHRALDVYPPFTLVVLGLDEPAQAATWDGRALTRLPAPLAMPLSSSSFRTADVLASRRAVFAAMQAARGIPGAWLADYHRSHDPERGPRSVCMHRPDARTVSFSRVRVTRRGARFDYHAGPPCTPAADTAVDLTFAGGRAA